MTQSNIGISGFASYLPPNRVQLADWCQWTGDQFDKIRNVVGSSFRMRGANENAYTMGATAVLRLIQQYGIDPSRIGYLALGTESSTDNSAGALTKRCKPPVRPQSAEPVRCLSSNTPAWAVSMR